MNTIIILGVILLLLFVWRKFAGGGNINTIPAAQFDDLKLKHSDLQILDVRTPAEVAQGKIPGAKVANVMSSDFQKQIEKLDKSKPYLVYCRSGNRSFNACRIMTKAGFEQLYNLGGGYSSWSR